MISNNPLNDQAQARGAAARTQLHAVASKPLWNIVGGDFDAIVGQLFGPPLAFWWDEDEDDEMPPCGYTVTAEGIAIIPIHGTLVDSEPSWWMNYLGYCSIPGIARAVRAAGADITVKNLLLDVDSPGGHVSGLAAACDAVWTISQGGEKEVWAACKKVASAAYEITSQANKMYLSPDGMAGCIGTIYLLSDWSGYYTQMGIVNLRVASTGAETYKGAGARGTKITAAQIADFKRLSDEFRQIFNVIIQRGRGFSDETMLALADGRIHIGANALQLSLVDGIATPEAVLSALGGGDDLDDLAGPPSQTDPDDDGDDDNSDDDDEDASDLDFSSFSLTDPDFYSQSFDLTQFIADQSLSREATQENPTLTTKPNKDAQTAEPANRLSTLMNWLNGGGAAEAAPAQAGASQTADPHPVLAAAIAAGIDTPEKLTALVNGNKARQEADAAAATQALTDARTAAQNAAVTAFGQDTPQLKAAQATITALDNVPALSAMTDAYKAVRPPQLKPGAARQTVTGQTTVTEETEKPQDKVQEGLNPSNVYAARRTAAKRR